MTRQELAINWKALISPYIAQYENIKLHDSDDLF